MKDKNLKLKIKKYPYGTHWYVFTNMNGLMLNSGFKTKHFNHYEDAREYAFRCAYAKNIETID